MATDLASSRTRDQRFTNVTDPTREARQEVNIRIAGRNGFPATRENPEVTTLCNPTSHTAAGPRTLSASTASNRYPKYIGSDQRWASVR